MTNSDETPSDPLADLEETARTLESLAPEVLAALGGTAIGGEAPESVSARVTEASRRIVEVLTRFADTRAVAQTATPESHAQTTRRRISRAPQDRTPGELTTEIVQTSEPVSLSEEDLRARVDEFFYASSAGDNHIGYISRFVSGGPKLERETHRQLIRLLNANQNAVYLGNGEYGITPIARPETPQLPDTDFVKEEEPEPEPIVVPEEIEDYAEESVEENEDEIAEERAAMSARWMGRRTTFRMADLRRHLLANGIVTEAEVSGTRMNRMFEEILKPGVEAYYADRGDAIVWLDENKDPESLLLLTGVPPNKKAGTQHSLAFQPRKKAEQTRPAQELVVAERTSTPVIEIPEVAEPVITEGQRERTIPRAEIDWIVSQVNEAGGAVTIKKFMSKLEEANPDTSPHRLRELIDAAIAVGTLYRRGVSGSPGISTELRTQKQEQVASEVDLEKVQKAVDDYIAVTKSVIGVLISMHPKAGYAYDKLWNQTPELHDRMDFEDFKVFVKDMARDGLVSIPTDAKLHTKTPHSQKRIGPKVMMNSKMAREAWRTSKAKVMRELREKALKRQIG